jgi:hypothetical protein
MKLTLKTIENSDCRTGILTLDNHTWFTIEQPWNNNLQGHSCVPKGTYELIPHNSPKHPNTWALHNPSNNIYAEESMAPVGGRFDCLIHPANWAFQLEGCIAPGHALTTSENGLMVTSSQEAFNEIQSLLGIGTTGHTLEIV